jgi:acetolactate synthase-1/2/3 large subunit
MLLIGGQGALDQHRMGSLQDLPHVDMLRPVTKFASSVVTTERVADMVSMAFREALAGAPGPSYLEIGRDVLDGHVALERAVLPRPGRYRASTKSIGDPADIERLAQVLVNAERPCVLLGSQVWTCRGSQAAVDFARSLNIPVFMNGAARGTLPPGDRHHFHLTRRHAFNQADVIVIVGTPFDFRMGYGKRLSQEATVAQIDLDYRTVGKNRDVDLGLVGDPGAILAAVTQAASGRAGKARERERWLQALRVEEQRLVEERLPRLLGDSVPIHPLRLAHEINLWPPRWPAPNWKWSPCSVTARSV